MEIRRLEPEAYAGRKFTARYWTRGYYDICAAEDGFRMRYVPLPEPMEKSFDDAFFGEWLEAPVAFGAFEGETLIGYVEGSVESWNNRFRISNICVFDRERRSVGVGTRLMETIQKEAAASGADDCAGDAVLQRERDCILSEKRVCNHWLRPVCLYQRRSRAARGPRGDGEEAALKRPTLQSSTEACDLGGNI